MSNKQNNIKLLNWNANGLKRQTLTFELFLQQHKIDIACVTETHLVINEKFYIRGYKIYRNDRPSETAAGGVAVLISNKIKHVPIDSPNSINLETIAISTVLFDKPHNIISAYKPPSKPFPLSSYQEIFNSNKNPTLLTH